ncbi:hypothetical protein F5Y11DRAFT_115551 [Daldinia sp. FL1419]|nr:hypothetical protein F5Y11DRAFT_115551 [Daldinia sp. FL1419]
MSLRKPYFIITTLLETAKQERGFIRIQGLEGLDWCPKESDFLPQFLRTLIQRPDLTSCVMRWTKKQGNNFVVPRGTYLQLWLRATTRTLTYGSRLPERLAATC